ncbi:hypothetical protein DEALK_05400 [Dehalogenimonas alkenigignens]|uniref:Uncharacterized protein n=1 Tax=Dehalogenimonas alkenigignens TaxID=1217799 RepID=A0A0W0GGK8_9CHLR|nr:hypothetical protein [Dehalogenimonas alkenigignens]KTB47695.1 hypothetical protein DEALK_05400 [Dehalogenimonas alkenigignens]
MFEGTYACPRCKHPLGGDWRGDAGERLGNNAAPLQALRACAACGLYLCPPPDESRFRAYGRRPAAGIAAGANT